MLCLLVVAGYRLKASYLSWVSISFFLMFLQVNTHTQSNPSGARTHWLGSPALLTGNFGRQEACGKAEMSQLSWAQIHSCGRQEPFVILPFSLFAPVFSPLFMLSPFLCNIPDASLLHKDPYFLFLKPELELNWYKCCILPVVCVFKKCTSLRLVWVCSARSTTI